MSITIISLVIAAVFIGALTRAVFGFGEAVVSMPLLAILPISLHTAVPLIGLAGLTVAILTVSANWRELDWLILARLALATLAGIPIGLFLVKFAPERTITLALGVFLVLYSVYSVAKPVLSKRSQSPLLNKPFWAYPFGFASGALGSAYNFNGVPVVVYSTLRKWPPAKFRGMMQAHFLFSGILIVSGQGLAGLWSKELFILYGFSVPAIILATIGGTFLHKKIPRQKFELLVYLFIFLLGLLLVVNPG